MDVKVLNTLEEFSSVSNGIKYGVYLVEIDGYRKEIVSRNHNTFTVLVHPIGSDDYLHRATDKFTEALIKILGVSERKDG